LVLSVYLWLTSFPPCCFSPVAGARVDPSFTPPSLAAFLAPEFSLCSRAPRPISCFHRRFASRGLDFPNRFLTPIGRSAHAQCSVKDFSIFVVRALALILLGSCCQDSRFLGQIRQGALKRQLIWLFLSLRWLWCWSLFLHCPRSILLFFIPCKICFSAQPPLARSAFSTLSFSRSVF
jgi:hypothetical protein